jgi:hypothetical protein
MEYIEVDDLEKTHRGLFMVGQQKASSYPFSISIFLCVPW